jgi:hypothetical protein
MTRHAIPAWGKGHCCQGQSKVKAVPRTQKGQILGKRHWAKPERINGMRDSNLKEKREDNQQDLQEGYLSGDYEAKC